MRVMAVSDRVMDQLYAGDVRRRYADIDLLISCGDLPYYYLEFLASALDVPLFYVRGNHDAGPQYTAEGRVLTSVQGGKDLHCRVAYEDGLLIAGLEGSMRYRADELHMYTETEMTLNVLRLVPALVWNRLSHGRAVDILITHSPPYQIHDGRDIPHTGFRVFRTFMRFFRPRYLLHGHMHVYRRDVRTVTRFRNTTVVNVYPYRVFEYGDL